MLLATDALWRDGALLRNMGLEITAGRVSDIRPLGTDTPDLHAALVAPLFTDLQVNGGGGVMVNGQPNADGCGPLRRRIGAAAPARSCPPSSPTAMT